MILVTGATGLVGRHLIAMLCEDGVEVRALSRRPEAANLPHGVRVVGGELRDPASPAPALTGVEAVYLFSAGRAGIGFAASAARADAATAPIHEADLAAVAAIVLRGGHAGRRYSLTGPQSLTFREQVAILARALGRELAFVEETPDQARERMARHGVPVSVIDELLAMWAATAGVAPTVPPTVSPAVERLTGLPGRSFAQWADEHAGDFR
ncbi:NAD(P)H-binding protein [Nonomuraea wenchangensis]